MARQLYARESTGVSQVFKLPVGIAGWTFALSLSRQKGAEDLSLGMAAGEDGDGFAIVDAASGEYSLTIAAETLQGIADTTGSFTMLGELLATPPGEKEVWIEDVAVTVEDGPFGAGGHVGVRQDQALLRGPAGPAGEDGLSAYQVWLASGHQGSQSDFWNWIVSQYPLTVTAAAGAAVSHRALMAGIAQPVPGQAVFLMEPGRIGWFMFDPAPRTAQVTIDQAYQFATVAPNVSPTGKDGAYVRVDTRELWLEQGGAVADAADGAGTNVFPHLKALFDLGRFLGGKAKLRYGPGNWFTAIPALGDDDAGNGCWADWTGFALEGPEPGKAWFQYPRGMTNRALFYIGNRSFSNGVDEFLPDEILFRNVAIDFVNGGGACMGWFARRPYAGLTIEGHRGKQSGIEAGELMKDNGNGADRWLINFAPNPLLRVGEDNRSARGGRTTIRDGVSRHLMQHTAGGGWGVEDKTVTDCESFDAKANAFAYTTNSTVARVGKVFYDRCRIERAWGRAIFPQSDVENRGHPQIGDYPQFQAVSQTIHITNCQLRDCPQGVRAGAAAQNSFNLLIDHTTMKMSSATGHRIRFGPEAIDLATGIFTVRNHKWLTGAGVYLTLDAGAVAPGGMIASSAGPGIYYAERLNKDQFRLHGLLKSNVGLFHPVKPTSAGSGGFGLNFINVDERRLAVGTAAGVDAAANTVTVLGDSFERAAGVKLGLVDGALPGGTAETVPYYLDILSSATGSGATQTVARLCLDAGLTQPVDLSSAGSGSFNLYLSDPDPVSSGLYIQGNGMNWAQDYHGYEVQQKFAAADVDPATNTIALATFANGEAVQMTEESIAPGGMAALGRWYVKDEGGGRRSFWMLYDGTTFTGQVDITSTGSGAFFRLAPLIRHTAVDVALNRITFPAPHGLPMKGGGLSLTCVTGDETMIGGVSSAIPYFYEAVDATTVELFEQREGNTGDSLKPVNITSQGLGAFQVALWSGTCDLTVGAGVWIDPKYSLNRIRDVRGGRIAGTFNSRLELGALVDVDFVGAKFGSIVTINLGGTERVNFLECLWNDRGNAETGTSARKLSWHGGNMWNYDHRIIGGNYDVDFTGVASATSPDGFYQETVATDPAKRKGPGLTVRDFDVNVEGTPNGPFVSFDMNMGNVRRWINVNIPENIVSLNFPDIAVGTVGSVAVAMPGASSTIAEQWVMWLEPLTNKSAFDLLRPLHGRITGAGAATAYTAPNRSAAAINPPLTTFRMYREKP